MLFRSAMLTATLLDQGAGAKSAEQIAETIDFVGGVLGTGAGTDLTYVNAVVMKDSYDVALDLVADVVQRPTFAPDEVERQRQQAQAARMTLYRYDFKACSSELNAAGQGRLARISRQLRVGHGAIFVEASGAGPMLDTARRESVTELLKSLQQEVSVDSVQTIGAPEFSLDSESALLIHANRLQQTKSRGGSSGISGGGSSAGGGSGAQSGGLIQ